MKLKAVDLLMTNVDVVQIIMCPRDTSKNREAQRMRVANNRQKCPFSFFLLVKKDAMYIIKDGKCLPQLTFNYKNFLLFFPPIFKFSFSNASSISVSGEMNNYNQVGTHLNKTSSIRTLYFIILFTVVRTIRKHLTNIFKTKLTQSN